MATRNAGTRTDATRRMMEGTDLAALGIGHNSGADPLNLDDIEANVNNDADVIALAERLGNDIAAADRLGSTTKVRGLVGVAIGCAKVNTNMDDKELLIRMVQGYAKLAPKSPSMNGALSYLRGAVKAHKQGVLVSTLNALSTEYDNFKGVKSAFENAFYGAVRIAKDTGKVPSKKELAEKIKKPEPRKADPKAKTPAAPVAPLTIDEIMANTAKVIAAETVNMVDADLGNLIKSFAAQIKTARDELKKAKPTEGKEVVKVGKKKASK